MAGYITTTRRGVAEAVAVPELVGQQLLVAAGRRPRELRHRVVGEPCPWGSSRSSRRWPRTRRGRRRCRSHRPMRPRPITVATRVDGRRARPASPRRHRARRRKGGDRQRHGDGHRRQQPLTRQGAALDMRPPGVKRGAAGRGQNCAGTGRVEAPRVPATAPARERPFQSCSAGVVAAQGSGCSISMELAIASTLARENAIGTYLPSPQSGARSP